jgi:hypothetical protein
LELLGLSGGVHRKLIAASFLSVCLCREAASSFIDKKRKNNSKNNPTSEKKEEEHQQTCFV